MRFQVLGPFEVRDQAGEPIAITAEKPQRLLAALLLHANDWVSVDALVDALWPAGPPSSARGNLKTYVHQVRQLVPAEEGTARIDSRPGWYRLNVAPAELDALEFEQRVSEGLAMLAEGSAEAAAVELRAARDLWRGDAYGVLDSEAARAETARLTELRRVCGDALADALIAAGRPGEAAAELAAATEADPLHEATWQRLVTALHAAGRRADALAAYRKARELLVTELGIEPGAGLREAQQRVLDDEPTMPRDAAQPAAAGDGTDPPADRAETVTSRPARRWLRQATQRVARHPMRAAAVAAAVVVAVLGAVVGQYVTGAQGDEPRGRAAGVSGERRPIPAATGTGSDAHKLLFGMGDDPVAAARTDVAKRAPLGMLTTWYDDPNDLTTMTAYREDTAPRTYRSGRALHLVVAAWDEPKPFDTKHGRACVRAYPLSDRFPDHMRKVAKSLAGAADGPSLYVSMFMGFDTYGCIKDAYRPDALNVAYYKALKDRYLQVMQIFRENAPNARISLGWDGWEASIDDDQKRGGGPSMFKYFADVMHKSDFQSFGMRETDGSNPDNMEDMVRTLAPYGPVMVAYYKPWNDSVPTFASSPVEVR